MAHRRLTKAQVAYPQILSAYDAVAQWIGAQGRSGTGSPREVYFADWSAAGKDRPMCKRFITVALALSASASSVVAHGQGVSALPAAGRLPGAPNCPMFPQSNVWNRDISKLPVAKNSAQLIAAIGLNRGLHPDFGSYSGYGIPYMVVSGHQHKVPVQFDYADESDK